MIENVIIAGHVDARSIISKKNFLCAFLELEREKITCLLKVDTCSKGSQHLGTCWML